MYGIQSIIYSPSAVATAVDTLYCTNVTELTNKKYWELTDEVSLHLYSRVFCCHGVATVVCKVFSQHRDFDLALSSP